MQLAKYSDGSFVLHKMPYGAGKLSAWYDKQGNLVDVERFDRTGRLNNAGIKKALAHARYVGLRVAGGVNRGE